MTISLHDVNTEIMLGARFSKIHVANYVSSLGMKLQ